MKFAVNLGTVFRRGRSFGLGLIEIRTCLHKKCVRIFKHNFVADKAKIRRRAVARQGFLTQSAAKFAKKTYAYAYEDRFLTTSQTKGEFYGHFLDNNPCCGIIA